MLSANGGGRVVAAVIGNRGNHRDVIARCENAKMRHLRNGSP